MFLLDFFFGYLGVGRFLLSLVGSAVGKLVVFVVTIVVSCISCCMDSYDDCYDLARAAHVIFGLAVGAWFVSFHHLFIDFVHFLLLV